MQKQQLALQQQQLAEKQRQHQELLRQQQEAQAALERMRLDQQAKMAELEAQVSMCSFFGAR